MVGPLFRLEKMALRQQTDEVFSNEEWTAFFLKLEWN